VTRLLDDANALRQWGGRILAPLARVTPELARSDPALARRVAEAVWTFQETRDEAVDFGGPLLPITFKRGQEADHARWQLGEIFPELCREHLPTATAIFTDIVDASLTPTGRADDAALWPLALGDARGWLASYGPDLEALDREEAVPAMARALRDAHADAGTRGGEPGPMMAMLVDNMHSASAWAALLTPGADTDGLAAAFLPLLTTGSLLGHPDTHKAAGTLLRALAAHADDELHARLESAVRAAGKRATGAGLRRPERIVDELLGCLDPARVTGDAEKDRLASFAEEGGPPALTPPARAMSWFAGRETLLERLAERGTILDAPLATAIGQLDEAVALASADEAAETAQAARQRIPSLFLAADGAGATDPATPRPIQYVMTEAAVILAGDVNVMPGTALGRRVIDILLQAAISHDAGRMLS
jgi:hypothetical protein